MTQTATLLILLASEPNGAERALLADFARQSQITLVAPAPTPAAPYPAYSSELVLDIEGRLDEARTLASSLDEERALTLLSAIERDLVDHPELPQAAWLLAEHHRIAADVRRADANASAEVAALSRGALVLEGPRAPAFGGTAETELTSQPSVRLSVHDLDLRDSLEIDGSSGGAERRVAPGVHHVRVLRDRELVFAGWLELGATPDVVLGVRPIAPCSDEDLSGAHPFAGSVAVPHAVACAHWFVARRKLGTLEVASCRNSACGAFMPLVATRQDKPLLPTWAAVTLVSAGAVAAGFLTAWATGGFEREPAAAPKTTFVYGGLH